MVLLTLEDIPADNTFSGVRLDAIPSTALVNGVPFETLPNDTQIDETRRRSVVSRASLRIASSVGARYAEVSQSSLRIAAASSSSSPPSTIFEDGFKNQNHNAWIGGSGGRNQACDCITVCPGGSPNTADPLDSYVADGAGYLRRTTMRAACKSLVASCLNACELVKYWPNNKLGQTEFLGHRMRVTAPYTNQVDFCLFSQFGYSQLKYNGLGLNLVGTNLHVYCNLGYSAPSPTHYTNAQAYTPRAGAGNDHPVAVGSWHDYIWEVTYSTIFGTDATHTVPGKLKVYHRLPGTTSAWTTIWDSTTLYPGGVPTRQWGYGLNDDVSIQVNNLGINTKTSGNFTSGAARAIVDKVGAYRGVNNNNLTIDHRKMCVASSFVNAEAYLGWPS